MGTRFFLPNFDINANDTCIFTFSASSVTTKLSSVQMTDVAGTGAGTGAPEPVSLGLLGMSLAGLGAIRRKREPAA